MHKAFVVTARECLRQWILRNKQCDPGPMVDKLHAGPLILKLAGKIEACPAAAFALVHLARRTAAALVIGCEHRYWSARRPDEHIRLDGIRSTQVIRPVDAALRRLKCLPRAVRLHVAASILDGDCALPHNVVDEPGMVVP